MHHLIFPDHLECAFQFDEDLPDLLLGQFVVIVVLGDMSFEIGVFAVLEDEVDISGGLFVVEEGDDVGVFHDREDLEFEVDALEIFLFYILEVDLFDRVGGALGGDCLVYFGVGAGAYFLQQQVGADFPAFPTIRLLFHAIIIFQKHFHPYHYNLPPP